MKQAEMEKDPKNENETEPKYTDQVFIRPHYSCKIHPLMTAIIWLIKMWLASTQRQEIA